MRLVVEGEAMMARLRTVPGPPPKLLTAAERRRLEAAARRIIEAEQAWARTVRELGIAGCARAMGITPQALASRLRRIERQGRIGS